MSLRDQLLKSGLASKEQAKKASREAKKVQHQKLKEAKDSPAALNALPDAEEKLRAQREADRLANQQRNEERLLKEAEARAIDIMVNNDLRESRAAIPYYFLSSESRISHILVTDAQQAQLENGKLAIVAFDRDYRFFLVSEENAEKIRSGRKDFIVCQHQDPI